MSECCQVGSEAHPGPCPLHDVKWRRLKSCIEEWPECYSGGYDPRCCRFPKSCSCMDSPLLVSEDNLEPIPAAEEPPARLPDASNPEEAIPWIRDNLRDGWTANSDAVRTLLAEYDRMRTELDQRKASTEWAIWSGPPGVDPNSDEDAEGELDQCDDEGHARWMANTYGARLLRRDVSRTRWRDSG